MGLLTDIMCLEPTGWSVNTTSKWLVKGGLGVAGGFGRIDASFKTPGGVVGVTGSAFGYGVGTGAQFQPGQEFLRSIVKYASALKFLSAKSDFYSYAPFTKPEKPNAEKLRNCYLVLTTLSGNAGVLGGSLEYYAFYRCSGDGMPIWMFFAAGAEVSGGGSGSTMQFRTGNLDVIQG